MTPSGKPAWRELLLARRRALPADVRATEAARLAAWAAATCALATPGLDTVCAYLPTADEPGSLGMLDALRARGRRVLLPIAPPAAPDAARPGRAPSVASGPLHWAQYLGPAGLTGDGPWWARRPTGADLGADAIAAAGLVLVPALAVDRDGVRLGRGGGWYDHSLPLAAPGTPLLAVVRDEELVAGLPREAHDVAVSGVLTPMAGPRTIPPPLF